MGTKPDGPKLAMDSAEGCRRRIRCQGSSLPLPFRHQHGTKEELNNHLDKIQNEAPLYLSERDTQTPLNLGSIPPSHLAPATMAGGGEVSASVANLAAVRERQNEEGETAVVLTEDPAEASASSGKVQRGQNGDGDLRCWRLKTTAMAAPQGVRRRTAWRGGRGLRHGAFGLVGEARPWRWARQQRAAATARSVVLARERERGGDEHG